MINKALRQRFESHLPRYGTLWKSMASKESFQMAVETKSILALQALNIENSSLGGSENEPWSAPICLELDQESPSRNPHRCALSERESSSGPSGGRYTEVIDFANLKVYDELPERTPSPRHKSSLDSSDLESSITYKISKHRSIVNMDVNNHIDSPNSEDTAAMNPANTPGFIAARSESACVTFEKRRTRDSQEESFAPSRTHTLQEGSHQEESFAVDHGETDFEVSLDVSSEGIDGDSSDASSSGSTVVRFDISHLQDDRQILSHDEAYETLPPPSPSINMLDNSISFGTPCVGNGTRNDPCLVCDSDSEESTWVRAKVSSKHLCILSESDTDSELEWNDLSDMVNSDAGVEEFVPNSIRGADAVRAAGRPRSQHFGAENHTKKGFRQNRERLMSQAFKEFDEVVFDGKLSKVQVKWSNKLRTTAGLTRCTKDKLDPNLRCAMIELSEKVIDELPRLRHTLLHEMCHAAQWLIDGQINPPHGACFQKWANHSMSKVQDVIVTTTHAFAIQYKYAWTCTTEKCNTVFQRQSKSIDIERHLCGKCKGHLVEINVPKKGTNITMIDRTPKQQKALSSYASFVKNNSAQVRSQMELNRSSTGLIKPVSQSEVMKECAKLWRVAKNRKC